MIELLVQAIWPRRAGARLRSIWYIVEPTALVLALMAATSALGWALPYGRSGALFLASGAVAVVTFLRATREVEAAVLTAVSAFRLATVSLFDRPVAAALARGALAVPGTALCLAVAGMLAPVAAVPDNMLSVATGLVASVMLGFGAGLALGAAALPRGWARLVWAALTLGMVAGSGLFHVPSELPVWLRGVVALNPLMHAVELLRTGVFGTYPTIVYWGGYLAIWCLGAPAIGIGLVWSRRRALSQ